MQQSSVNCQRDEFPPARIWQARNHNVWIRFLPAHDNAAVANLFKGCPNRVIFSTLGKERGRNVPAQCPGGRETAIITETVQPIDVVIEFRFANMPNIADAGLTANPCWPKTLVNDPGFALNFNDPWYLRATNAFRRQYTQYYTAPPGPQFTQGKINQPGWEKRDEELLPDDIIVNQGNSSRRATDEELLVDFGLLRCTGDCSDEMADLGYASLPLAEKTSVSLPEQVTAEATSTSGNGATATTLSTIVNAAASTIVAAAEALVTEMPEYPAFEDDEDDLDINLDFWP